MFLVSIRYCCGQNIKCPHAETCIRALDTYIQVYICVDVDFLVVWIMVFFAANDIVSKRGKIYSSGVCN